jgi:alpha-D-ribose 1-methylphosphonate 5-triphosphate synthase subunit PhnG
LGDLRGAGHAAVADALLVDFRRASSPAMNVAGLLAAVAHPPLLGDLRGAGHAAVADALLVDFRRASSPAMNVAGPLAAVAHALLGSLWDR